MKITETYLCKPGSTTLVTILRGIQGTGKSTYAKHHLTGAICSADDYFVKDGVYNFDANLLHVAHDECYRKAHEALKNRQDVIIDNTNCAIWEVRRYINLARCFYSNIRIMSIYPSSMAEGVEWAQRNKHGVPVVKVLEKLQRMPVILSVEVADDIEDVGEFYEVRVDEQIYYIRRSFCLEIESPGYVFHTTEGTYHV